MLPVIPLLVSIAQLPADARAGENNPHQLQQTLTPAGLSFTWQDTEDSLKGAVAPAVPRAGEEMEIAATLQPLSGPDYDGPLTFALRPLESMGATETVTVTRNPGARSWVARFTPREPGPHRLEFSWRSTHYKVVRGVVEVAPAGLPRWFGWVFGIGLVSIALAGGLWSLFRGRESSSS